jgi:hypothetical protein
MLVLCYLAGRSGLVSGASPHFALKLAIRARFFSRSSWGQAGEIDQRRWERREMWREGSQPKSKSPSTPVGSTFDFVRVKQRQQGTDEDTGPS